MVYKKRGKVIPNLSIYYHISQGLNPSQIAKKYNWKKGKVTHYTTKLKQLGLIKRVGYGTWEITDKQVSDHLKVGGDFLNLLPVRGHNFQFKLKLPNIPKWKKRVEVLTKNNMQFTLVGNKGSIVRIIHKNHKVWLCDKSIIVYYPKDMSFFGRSAVKSRAKAIHHFFDIISSLERVFRVSLKINKEYLFTIPRKHYALIKNEFARDYLEKGKKLEIRSRDGQLWALIDNSHNLEEFELVHPVTAERDTDKVVEPFMNILRENPKVLQEMIANISLNTRVMNEMQKQIMKLTDIVKYK